MTTIYVVMYGRRDAPNLRPFASRRAMVVWLRNRPESWLVAESVDVLRAREGEPLTWLCSAKSLVDGVPGAGGGGT